MQSFLDLLWLFLLWLHSWKVAPEITLLTKPKLFLSGLLQKNFAEPCFRDIKSSALYQGREAQLCIRTLTHKLYLPLFTRLWIQSVIHGGRMLRPKDMLTPGAELCHEWSGWLGTSPSFLRTTVYLEGWVCMCTLGLSLVGATSELFYSGLVMALTN